MRVNKARVPNPVRTHEGAPAARISAYQQLRRSVLSCLLWEKEFYESGEDVAQRITKYAELCTHEEVRALALEARHIHGLRHAPLLLLLDLVRRGGSGVGRAISETIRRADEVSELVALYWRDGKRPLSKQMKLGLAAALNKFDEYQLAKYNRDGAVALRDVLFLTRAKPKDDQQAALFAKLADGQLVPPDTWEVALSGGASKRETFERLLRERNLGYMALLRNLRGMLDAGVDAILIRNAILERRGAQLVLPHRYVAAARAAPQLEPCLDVAMQAAIKEQPTLEGRTIVLVDVSGSMGSRLSSRSDLTRMDAAATLAAIVNAEATLAAIVNAESLRVFTFSNHVVEVPPRRGMAGIDAIIRSQRHGGTELGAAVEHVNRHVEHDRLIVITDEQSRTPVPAPVARRAYMINVASAENGIGYGRGWTHLDGFSEAVLRWIAASEAEERPEA